MCQAWQSVGIWETTRSYNSSLASAAEHSRQHCETVQKALEAMNPAVGHLPFCGGSLSPDVSKPELKDLVPCPSEPHSLNLSSPR